MKANIWGVGKVIQDIISARARPSCCIGRVREQRYLAYNWYTTYIKVVVVI